MENYRHTNADDYAALSRRLVRQAQEEFDTGDRLQASEKGLGRRCARRRGYRREQGLEPQFP